MLQRQLSPGVTTTEPTLYSRSLNEEACAPQGRVAPSPQLERPAAMKQGNQNSGK